jgi:hypothetical protein
MPVGATLAALGAAKAVGGAVAPNMEKLLKPATAALAIGQRVAGKIGEKRADKLMPRMEDPEERALASYATRRKRAFQTGTAMQSQRNALLQAMKSGTEASFKVGGGAKGLNQMNRMFNEQMLGMQDASLAGEAEFARQEKDTKTRISQKKLELGLLKYNTEQARAAQMTKESRANSSAVLASLFGGAGGVNPYGTAGQDVTNTTTGTTSTTTGVESSSEG